MTDTLTSVVTNTCFILCVIFVWIIDGVVARRVSRVWCCGGVVVVWWCGGVVL